MNDLPMIGFYTEKEVNLSLYLGNCISDWIEKHETDRTELIAALSTILLIMFTKQTRLDTEGQCKEIDNFCDFLKDIARKIIK